MTIKIHNNGVDDVETSITGSHYCRRCAGTGRFITYVENNVPKGPGGPCFRCGGKGHHTQADRKRNDCYDRQGYYVDRAGEHQNVVKDLKRGSLDGLI